MFSLDCCDVLGWGNVLLFFGCDFFFEGSFKPGLENSTDQPNRKRFRTCGWVSLGILLFTGPLRLYQKGLPLHLYGNVLQVKLFLFFVMVLLTLFHYFVLGPESIAISRAGLASRFQTGVRWTARLNLLIGLAIVLSAVFLVHGF